jgi:hypothetical protein
MRALFWLMIATVQFKTFLSSHLLPKNVNIKIYKTIILHIVLYGFEILSFDI